MKEIKENYKGLPWKEMAGMRDKIVHFYFGVDYNIVYKIIKEESPQIKPSIQKMLDEIGEEE